MTKKKATFYNIINVLTDVLLSGLAYLSAIFVYLHLIKGGSSNIAQDSKIVLIYSLYLIVLYRASSLYSTTAVKPFGHEILKVIQINTIGLLTMGLMLYFFRLEDFSRGVLGYFYLFSISLIISKRAIFFQIRKKHPKLFYNKNYVMVVGNGPLAKRFMSNANSTNQYIIKIVGYVSNDETDVSENRLGSYSNLDVLLNEFDVDKVVIALEPDEISCMTQVISACDKQGSKAYIIPFYNDYFPKAPEIDVLGDIKLLNMRTIPLDNAFSSIQKRLFDIVLSLLLIILSSPFMLLAFIGVKISSPGPAIFKQKRVGRNKKEFTMYKFRSMKLNDTSSTAWSKNTDSRKTRFGSFIRKTSIDELPQFFNVLKGDMSLVGPRPEIPFFVNQFKETVPLYMLKHQVRPGITGWAQVNGFRGDTSIEGRIKCDLFYIENWNILLDIRILFKTVFVALINDEKMSNNKKKSKD